MSYNGVTGRTHEYILTGLEQIVDEFEQDNDMACVLREEEEDSMQHLASLRHLLKVVHGISLVQNWHALAIHACSAKTVTSKKSWTHKAAYGNAVCAFTASFSCTDPL